MNSIFSIILIIVGFVVASSIWAVTLGIKRYSRIGRVVSFVGIVALFLMLMYSIYYIKGASYSMAVILGFSVGMTIVWVLACLFFTGLLIILIVGSHWLYVVSKNTSFRELCKKIKDDFASSYRAIKNWVEGEEL